MTPIVLDQPVEVNRPAQSLGMVNLHQVAAFRFEEYPAATPFVEVTVVRGLRDVSGAVSWIDPITVRITGDALAALSSRLTTGQSLYAEIKQALYRHLQQIGVIPEVT